MEAKAEVKSQRDDRSGKRAGWQRGTISFLVTLIATLVLGFTPDFDGLLSWFLTRSPLVDAHLLRGR